MKPSYENKESLCPMSLKSRSQILKHVLQAHRLGIYVDLYVYCKNRLDAVPNANRCK